MEYGGGGGRVILGCGGEGWRVKVGDADGGGSEREKGGGE